MEDMAADQGQPDIADEAPFEPGQELGHEARCQWVSLHQASQHFVEYTGSTQSSGHIKPLHWYAACRLVVEGGFHPDDVSPRPPFDVERTKDGPRLIVDPRRGHWSEATVFGGLKTKNVDVVAAKPGLGPVLAISHKGVTGAFRNLTNRMEETIGECTNLHIAYPALVLGYFVALRANRTATKANDLAFQDDGTVVDGIRRFHAALQELTGRKGIRDETSRYEAIAMLLLETETQRAGIRVADFPPLTGTLAMDGFFDQLYRAYDERYVYGAPDLRKVTARIEWLPDSPALLMPPLGLDYEPRLKG